METQNNKTTILELYSTRLLNINKEYQLNNSKELLVRELKALVRELNSLIQNTKVN